ncbi:hypothetical protein JCM6292_1283 [Bacteroides pyogenes JCM 6292]|uniref:Uncharacterized protein n=2 Tax=Bacteroides pyogenes TaxID=310300 RepID=W4PH35_9BACE|nr:hypothetical protein JCM6292_1283 [Bacteroides pyogenes JCM 6292]GAE18728.1 hypothetical protein JCM6294_1672 [Bacteroides pyogenes DSM 20611 = JCM 6294]
MVSSTFFGSFCAFAGGGRRNAVHRAAKTSNFEAVFLCVKLFSSVFGKNLLLGFEKARNMNIPKDVIIAAIRNEGIIYKRF